MFGILTDTIENDLDVAGSLLSLEAPSKRKVARLISDGVEIAAIAAMFGVAEDVIVELAKK